MITSTIRVWILVPSTTEAIFSEGAAVSTLLTTMEKALEESRERSKTHHVRYTCAIRYLRNLKEQVRSALVLPLGPDPLALILYLALQLNDIGDAEEEAGKP
jgi:hypothetical protein